MPPWTRVYRVQRFCISLQSCSLTMVLWFSDKLLFAIDNNNNNSLVFSLPSTLFGVIIGVTWCKGLQPVKILLQQPWNFLRFPSPKMFSFSPYGDMSCSASSEKPAFTCTWLSNGAVICICLGQLIVHEASSADILTAGCLAGCPTTVVSLLLLLLLFFYTPGSKDPRG